MAPAPLGLDLHDCDFEPPVRVGAVHAADDGHPWGKSDEHPGHVLHSDRRADFSFTCSGLSGRQVRSAAAAVDRSASRRIELDSCGQGDDSDLALPYLRTAGWNRDGHHLHRGGGPHGAVVSGQARSRDGSRRRGLWRRRHSDDVSDRGDDADVELPACPVAVRRHLCRGRVPRGARIETPRSRLAGARFRAPHRGIAPAGKHTELPPGTDARDADLLADVRDDDHDVDERIDGHLTDGGVHERFRPRRPARVRAAAAPSWRSRSIV